MGNCLTTTVVVESRLLVREALRSLMTKHSYRVICSIASVEELSGSSTTSNEPKLVLLGTQSTENTVAETAAIRKLWPDSKIVLLFDLASLADWQQVLMSDIDGCVPLSASPDTLSATLDLVILKDARTIVITDTKFAPAPSPQEEEALKSETTKAGKLQSNGSATPITIVALPHAQSMVTASTANIKANNGTMQSVPALRNLPGLSEREIQILDGLVKGHANKVIARTCDITEATVKVHMKSILRKIRVTNRTQAAIWALENGRAADETKDRAPTPPRDASPPGRTLGLSGTSVPQKHLALRSC
jgi:two-component system, NarL family, nitrate/nitrite response regulator NarL